MHTVGRQANRQTGTQTHIQRKRHRPTAGRKGYKQVDRHRDKHTWTERDTGPQLVGRDTNR